MQIVCMTTSAAAQVVGMLLAMRLRPAADFEIHPILSTTPPIRFTPRVGIPADAATYIRGLPDTIVLEECAA